MSQQEELRQALLELHYDLLDDQQANDLRSRIQSDPEVATAWADTLRLAGQLADAAKVESPSLPKFNIASLVEAEPSDNGSAVTAPPVVAPPPVEAKQDAKTDRKGRQRSWTHSLVVAATAAAIGFLIIGVRFFDQAPTRPAAAIRLQAEALPGHQSDSGNAFRLLTHRIEKPAGGSAFPVTPASISFSVLARNTVLFSGEASTDASGATQVELPPDLAIPQGAQLRVTAHTDGLNDATIEVPLEPTRCLTYITVDRPVYRPGDTVFFRSLTLHRRSLRADVDVPIRFELLDPSGAVVPGAFTEGVTDRGVGNGAFAVPSAAPGGPYTLVAKSLDGFFPEERHEFQVRAYRVPRFKKELEFRRRSYGPGETVEADFSAERAEGGAVANAKLRIAAKVDDQVVFEQIATASPIGTYLVSFKLPEHIRAGVGQLSVVIDDGGTQETQTKTIPIQIGRVEVDFYPEGGYLVDGLQNRVYFSAHDTLGKPIHLAGEILDRSGRSVGTVETTRDGMGRFEFMARTGQRYSLKVTEPVDVTNSPRLPAVVKALPVIDTGSGVFDVGQPISLVVRSTKVQPVIVRAVCRGQLVGEQSVILRAAENSVSIPIPDRVGGVVRVTVLDAETTPARPLVERLVFRRNNKQLKVGVVEAESALERSPGDPLRLTLQVTDENDRPMPAVLGVSVVDDASLSLDETERPTLRTHFLLTSEVEKPEDLEHANFYLSDEPDAGESLDLLLGTQGWRRFVSGSRDQPNVDFRQQLVRLLELDGRSAEGPLAVQDNERIFAREWMDYRISLNHAWNRLLREARWVMLLALLVWFGAIVVRLPRRSSTVVTMWLLVTSASLFVYGCGGSREAASVAGSAKDMAALKMEAIVESTADGVTAEPEETHAPADEFPSIAPPMARIESDPSMSSTIAPDDDADESDRAQSGGFGASGKNRSMIKSGQWTESFDDSNVVARKYRKLSDPRLISADDLNRLLASRGLDAEALADQLLDELRFPVREYAHRHVSTNSDVREDFTETLYWHPMLITDSTGKATVRFDLSDSVTTFRVYVDGHGGDGRIGSGFAAVTSRLPFQIEPKLPLEVTTGDRIELPVAVINATDDEIGVALELTADPSLNPADSTSQTLTVSGGQRTRNHFTINVAEGAAESDAMIQIRGSGGSGENPLADTVRRRLHIAPTGYPVRDSIAGMMTNKATVQLPVPEDIVPGSLAVTIRAYPSPLADVMAGVEGILREPHGCFEQTSATNYPNSMALIYMQENEIASPDIARRAQGMLDRGYQKLTSFECEKLGYEWFGKDPGHEALSAFGLMQFTDMARVMEVSDEMITRTRVWLMGRRDGRGGFHRNPRHLHVWSVKQQIVNAYVLWAISEADVAAQQSQRTANDLGRELDKLNRVATESVDPYLIALSAAALMNAQRSDDSEALLKKLADLQTADGSLQGTTTVTSSGGLSLKMETTAIATLAWLKSPEYLPQARAAAKWIVANRQGTAGFGSTQATVLALKALVAMSAHTSSKSGGQLLVKHGSKTLGRTQLPDDPNSGSAVEITGLGERLFDADVETSAVEIELIAKGTRNLSYTIDIAYHAVTPKSHEDCPMKLKTELSGEFAGDGSIEAGQTMTVKTRLKNVSDAGQPMTVAIVGLPGGVEPRVEELDEKQEAGEFDYYELRGRDVVFYWRTIEPNATKRVEFSVTAAIPGHYTGPASRTYLYYTAEQKNWVEPLTVEIDPTSAN